MTGRYDIVVVGGGHAGCEAALAAARLGARVCLATLDPATIGALSCNPAIGGVGKGQLVREIDALGGAMARVADATAIQYRVLNGSKGEAVRSLRAQVDKSHYAQEMQAVVAAQERLDVVPAAVEDLSLRQGRLTGVVTRDGSAIPADRVVLTNGTFLRGLMHTGEARTAGGRVGEGSVGGLSSALERLGFERGRLKTGTPPRLAASSIDFARIERQEFDPHPEGFSHFTSPPRRPWVACAITRTNERAHEIIRRNLHRSPMYAGEIEGVGPRYCPSIEDKVVRFPDRSSHLIHLEPEGRRSDWIYVNGISTSLPADVQEEVVHAIEGLEEAVFLRHGYAVEYDFFPPHQIRPTFESRLVPGLYLAGQICGTSGYEEAAAQGLLAGINAARAQGGESAFILGRDEAYLGVLADDLVRLDPREPYRMFTARAEYRLLLRHDNADLRLVPRGHALGLVPGEAAQRVAEKAARIERALRVLRERRIEGMPIIRRLQRPDVDTAEFAARFPELAEFTQQSDVWRQVRIEARYEHYIQRQRVQIERLHRMETWTFPEGFDYNAVSGLRQEAREKLNRYRPATLGQAMRLSGVTPADVSILMVALRAEGGSPAPSPRCAGQRGGGK